MTSLDLPDGTSAEVEKIVAAKKIEIAAAGLHHAQTTEEQALERKRRTDEEDETEITKAKIADVKVNRFRSQIKSTEESLKKMKDQAGDMMVKEEEAKAAVAMASEKKKKDLEANLKLAEAKRTRLQQKMDDAQQSIQALAMQVVGAKEESHQAHEAQEQTRLKGVAQRVNYEAAKEQVSHAKFMELKSKNLKKLAVADDDKATAKNEKRQAKNDVRGAKEMLEIMNSGPGQKEAAKSLEKAKKRYEDTKKVMQEATKKVDVTKNSINDAEVKWAKKITYKAVMKTATLGAAANDAEKAYENALSEADRKGKKLAMESAKKDFNIAEKDAEKERAQLSHIEFAAKADKQARDEVNAAAKKKMEEEEKLAAKQKEQAAADKKALADAGFFRYTVVQCTAASTPPLTLTTSSLPTPSMSPPV